MKLGKCTARSSYSGVN